MRTIGTLRAMAFGVAIIGVTLASHAAAQSVSSAIDADPPPDAQHPADTAAPPIQSHGVVLDSRLYTASGAGAHPTLVMLDGLPGWHNLADVDMAVRRAGWNVLAFHYRGVWGEPGGFSIHHSVEDAAAAIAFLRRPDIAAKYGIDTSRLVIAGHSMGGFCAAAVMRNDTKLAGAVLIDAWDVGEDGTAARRDPATFASQVKAFGEGGHAVSGTNGLRIAREIRDAKDWDYINWAKDFAGRRLLIIGAQKGNGKESQALADAIGKLDASKLEAEVMPTDHGFSDHRIALTEKILVWLDTIAPVPQ